MKQREELSSRAKGGAPAKAPQRAQRGKRVLSALLSVVLVAGMAPSLSWADESAAEEQASPVESLADGASSAPLADGAAVDGADAGALPEDAGLPATPLAIVAPQQAIVPQAVEEVTIGTGSTSSNQTPYNVYYKNAGVQVLYTAAEIGKTGTITALSFYVATAGTMAQTSFKVYLGTTDKGSLAASSDALSADELTEVYSNDAQTLGSATGWETITLDTPFNYDGEKNLVVAAYRTAPSYSSALKYQTTSGTSDASAKDKALYRGNDGNTAYGKVDGTGAYYAASARPNIKISIDTCAHSALTHHDAVAPACGSGNVEYWSCDNCGKNFADAAASNELASIKADHAYTGTVTLAPTCAEDGTMTYACSVCGQEKEEVIPATKEHHFVDGFCTNLLRDGVTVCHAADVWDGATTVEPTTDEQGVYLIKDGSELAWFMNAAKADGYAGSARLMRDINLGELASWYLPGGASKDKGYQGTFDGNGHAITISYDAGGGNASLFNYVGENGVVKNLTVNGALAGVCAAAVSQYNYGTIADCVNHATITAQGANKAYAAGITVYDNSGIIERCANYAAITADATGSYASAYAGGIFSYGQSVSTLRNGTLTIRDCYNEGAVHAQKASTGTSNYGRAGGVVGYLSSSSSARYMLENCLNLGAVSAANSAVPSSTAALQEGGIIGAITYSAGNEANNQFSNCFYGQDCAEALYTCTTEGKTPAVETNCGAASAQDVADAAWVSENLGQWFVNLLDLSTQKHTVTFVAENATVMVKGEAVTQAQVLDGASLSFTVALAEGYGLDGVSVADEPLVAVDGVYTTAALMQDITVTVKTHAHAWSSGTVTVPATCGTAGEMAYACTVDGCTASRTEVIPATGNHELIAFNQVDATCTEAGTAAYWRCAVCAALFADAQGQTAIDAPAPIAALGHDFTAYRDNGNGTHSVVCSRCTEEKSGGWALESASDLVAGNTYVIVVGGYAMSCEDGNSASMRKGVPYTEGETAVDDMLLWVWGADGSLKSVATGQYLNSGSSYFYLVMGDAPTSVWRCSEGKMCTTTSTGMTAYLYPLSNATGNCVWGGSAAPAQEQLYTATYAPATAAHDYDENNVCTECGSVLTHRTGTVTVHDEDAFVNALAEGAAEPLYLVEATMTYLAPGYVPVVGEQSMAFDGTSYKVLVDAAAAQGIKEGTLAVDVRAGSAATVGAVKGDANANGHMNIVDAQVAYDMACARYATDVLPLTGFIAADVNGDNAVNAADAFAIQYALHYGWQA